MSGRYDVAVIGAGPGGLAAALAASEAGASTLLIERESRVGGILKQCIHDGFGLLRFKEKLAGPEYAQRFIDRLPHSGVKVLVSTFVRKIDMGPDGFKIALTSREGAQEIIAGKIVLATGCRERTAKQVQIHGTRPAGVYTAGTAQHYVNLMGELPVKKCVILGSGDIGLIMARRLTLEGAAVLGVYEAKPTPSGLSRNIAQCLDDFGIPLYTSKTVTRVFGDERLSAVEISDVDERMRPIEGTSEIIKCDGLIVSVGLIPENELARSLGIELDARTKSPVCDQNGETLCDGVFVCGNAGHVSDLVDYVSESGERAGERAARERGERRLIPLTAGEGLLCVSPQRIDTACAERTAAVFIRSASERQRTELRVLADGEVIYSKIYRALRPPEMERITLELDKLPRECGELIIELSEAT